VWRRRLRPIDLGFDLRSIMLMLMEMDAKLDEILVEVREDDDGEEED
jgi:hypothetical protein